MKILIYSDLHLSAKIPSHRIDNYPESILHKLREVYEISKDCDYIFFLGDFYNSHRIFNYELINEVISIIDSVDKNTYCLVGQHDLAGYNQTTYKTSTFCFTEKYCKNLKVLWKPIKIKNLIVHPCHCFDDFKKTVDKKQDLDKINILLAHKLISVEKFVYETYLVEDFCPCDYNAVLFGDLHTGIKKHREGKTLIWSPGALVRQAIKEYDRVVKVGILEVEEGDCEVKEIELKSVLSPEKVFSVKHIEQIKKYAKNLDSKRFIDKISEFESNAIDIYDMLEKIARDKKLKPEVIDYILSKKP